MPDLRELLHTLDRLMASSIQRYKDTSCLLSPLPVTALTEFHTNIGTFNVNLITRHMAFPSSKYAPYTFEANVAQENGMLSCYHEDLAEERGKLCP